jgi:type II secretion system protein I
MRSGFTLLEVVVALAIVGSVAIASLSTLDQHFRTARRAGETATAVALATERLEAIRIELGGRTSRLPDSLRRGRFPEPFQTWRWEAEIREVSGRPGLSEASVRILWHGGSYRLITRSYRPPLPGAGSASR